jgi:lactate permease
MFQQILDPIAGSLVISALCAALPLVLLFVLLGVFKVRAPIAALAGLALSLVLAVVGWQMPVNQALSATAAGMFYGLFPILWILVNALWIYRLTVATPSAPFQTTCGSCPSSSPSASARCWSRWPASALRWRSPPPC